MSPGLRTIGVVPHRDRPEARALAKRVVAWSQEHGISVRIPAADAIGLEGRAVPVDDFAPGLDLALSLGGDGTMLRTVDLVYEAGVPVLGVNVGQLGYLTEVDPADLDDALDRLLADDYVVADRMMLQITIESTGAAAGRWWALNETVLEKPHPGRLARLDVSINQAYFTSYAADGVIVATPTGSTAYSFSARGPIVSPRVRCLLLTPVSPHMLFDRSLVLDAEEELALTVSDDRSVLLTIDGRELGVLEPGAVVRCTGGPVPARVVTLGPRDFHQILKAKFGLADRQADPVLLELRITNLGIIEELAIVLGDGLSAITGETGAGKTLVVEALELLAGVRADTGLVRPGADEAHVEGRFEDPLTGEEIIVARAVPAEGRSRAYIDGRLATVTELAELGARLIDLHGQHAHQSLLAPAMQRAVLDTFAGPPALEPLADYQAARRELREVDEALGALGGDERTRAREVSLLQYEIEEIEAAGIAKVDEDATLEAEEDALGDAAADREALQEAHTAVDGGAAEAIGVATSGLTGRPAYAALAQRAAALQVELAEHAHDLRVAAEGVVEDPERLATVRERRRRIRELQRKYGDTLADVLAHRDEASARLAELEGREERTAELETRRVTVQERATEAAGRLHAARAAAAGALAEAVQERLQRLAMAGAELGVSVLPGDPGEDGADRVVFELAANRGEPALPLAKVASGGELSRAMLALRVVLAERGSRGRGPVLVFDEVDAGIGGEAGAAVGRELASLGEAAQVLCITHLAQVAACAGAQIVVRKSERDGRTLASAEVAQAEDRVAELSRMLAGVEDSDHARRHAEELLQESARSGGGR